MRLPASAFAALGLTVLLTACGPDRVASVPVTPENRYGPSADYPVVLGQPFVVDGITYTPEDRLNYDQVGYAGIDGGADGISIAHRTLPMPSYAEVTSLETGRTILVRVTRRGPMTGGRTIDLSPAAAAQLGLKGDRVAIRIRRVNPPEAERAALRGGGEAPLRMDTPVSLVNVLRRKLDPTLAPLPVPGAPVIAPPVAQPSPDLAAPPPAPVPASKPPLAAKPSVKPAVPAKPAAAKPPVEKPAAEATAPKSPKATTATPKKPEPARAVQSGLTVQVGAFSNRAASEALARKLGGTMTPTGKLFRVRIGPFSSRGEADAALAKAKAAGYSDARIQRAD